MTRGPRSSGQHSSLSMEHVKWMRDFFFFSFFLFVKLFHLLISSSFSVFVGLIYDFFLLVSSFLLTLSSLFCCSSAVLSFSSYSIIPSLPFTKITINCNSNNSDANNDNNNNRENKDVKNDNRFNNKNIDNALHDNHNNNH